MSFVYYTAISVSKEKKLGSSVLGNIQLPSSLFKALPVETDDMIGVWFTLYRKGSFFPPPEFKNNSLSTPVISATVEKYPVYGLRDRVSFSLQLFNKVRISHGYCVKLVITQSTAWSCFLSYTILINFSVWLNH